MFLIETYKTRLNSNDRKATTLSLMGTKKPEEKPYSEYGFIFELPVGLEPTTYWLQISGSTNWAKEAYREGFF